MNLIPKLIAFLKSTNTYVWLLLFVLANLLLKTYNITNESIYGDEAYSLFHSQQSLPDLVPYFLKDQNPPLHMLLLHYWMQLFGVSDVSAKMFSVICSIMAGAILFVFANKFLNKTTAIFVSLLFLLSNVQQYYAIEIRPYAFVQFLCITSFYFYFSLMNTPKKKYLFLLFFFNLLLLFTHYLTIFIFIVQFLCVWLFFKQNKKSLAYYFISQVLVLLAILPWLKVAFSNIPKAGSFWEVIPGWFEVRWHVNILLGNNIWFYAMNSLVAFLILLFLIHTKRNIFENDFKPAYFILFLLLFLLPIVLDYFVSQFTPVFNTRYFLYCLFGLFLLIAYSLAYLKIKTRYKVLLFMPLIICLISSFNIIPPRPDNWKHIVPQLKKEQTKETIILICSSYKFKDFSFYYNREAFTNYKKTFEVLAENRVYTILNNDYFHWEIINDSSITKIIYVQAQSVVEDPENKNPGIIISHGYKVCGEHEKDGIKYSVFVRKDAECYSSRIIDNGKRTDCDEFEKFRGLNMNNDTVDVYKASFELMSGCPLDNRRTDEQHFSGKYSIRINDSVQYSPGIIKPAENILKGKRHVRVSAYVYCEKNCSGAMNISLEKGDKLFFRQANYDLMKLAGEHSWTKVLCSADLPDEFQEGTELKIYLWNPAKANLYIDDMEVQIY